MAVVYGLCRIGKRAPLRYFAKTKTLSLTKFVRTRTLVRTNFALPDTEFEASGKIRSL